jgi:hypothetical protein
MTISHDIAVKIESFLQQHDSNSLETHQHAWPIFQAFFSLEEGTQSLLMSSNPESVKEVITRPICQILIFELNHELARILLDLLSDSDIVWTETASRRIVSIWFVSVVVVQMWVWWQRPSFWNWFYLTRKDVFPFALAKRKGKL